MLKSYKLFESQGFDESVIDLFPDAELLADVLYGIPDFKFKILPSLYRTRSIMKKDWFGGILIDENSLFHRRLGRNLYGKVSSTYWGLLEIEGLTFGKLDLPQGWTLNFDKVGNFENEFEDGKPSNNTVPCLSLALKSVIPVGKTTSLQTNTGKTHLITWTNDKNLKELVREFLDKLKSLQMRSILVSEMDNGVFWMIILEEKYFHER